MSNNVRTGHFTPDTADVNIPCGFIPDYVQLVEVGEGSNPNIITWFERQEDDESNTGRQEGTLLTGSTGVTTPIATSQGITAFDTGSLSPTVESWTEARGNSATARSGTVAGTFIKATVGGLNNLGVATDRDAIFECIVAGTSDASEPVWPTAIGDNVVNNSVTWERVNEPLLRIGYQGFSIANESTTNGQEMYYLALKADDSINHGDTVDWVNGTDPDWS